MARKKYIYSCIKLSISSNNSEQKNPIHLRRAHYYYSIVPAVIDDAGEDAHGGGLACSTSWIALERSTLAHMKVSNKLQR